jgi:hypothetical protein
VELVVNSPLETDDMARKFLICDGDAVREASSDELLRGAAALIAQRFRRGTPVLESPDLTRQYLRHQIGARPYEVFGLLLLDLCGPISNVQQCADGAATLRCRLS